VRTARVLVVAWQFMPFIFVNGSVESALAGHRFVNGVTQLDEIADCFVWFRGSHWHPAAQ